MSNNTKQHDKDMRKFEKEYEKTKADVWKKTRHFELRSHKRAVLGVLVFIVLLGMFLAAEVSSGYVRKFPEDGRRAEITRKPAARWKLTWTKVLMEICLCMGNITI